MADERPSPFNTVPRGFHYHNEAPKTPEREPPIAPVAQVPSPRGGFKVRRRPRPNIDTMSISTKTSEKMAGLHEKPLPSIEMPEQLQTVPMQVDPPVVPPRRLLTPSHQIGKTYPRTPMDSRLGRSFTPSERRNEALVLDIPSSPTSSLSDSSDDSFVDSEGEDSTGGSVTSPESDGGNPFTFNSPTKRPSSSKDSPGKDPSSPSPQNSTPKKFWTKDMDNHIWKTYQSFLNDPTVTPYKTLPGCLPPVGVCHRVAREARKSWKGGRAALNHANVQDLFNDDSSGGTSGVNNTFNAPSWPGAGSATRKRLRLLCKRKATIIPHYQRMIRSASPVHAVSFLPSPRARRRHTTTRNPWATRDIAMSLTTSTSATMQAGGPLQQIATNVGYGLNGSLQHTTTYQTTTWHTTAYHTTTSVTYQTVPPNNQAAGASITRLGSPFNGTQSNTWGPIRSRPHDRPQAVSLHPESSDTLPRLRSPVHFEPAGAPNTEDLINSARTPKRPAQTALEDELSNTDAEARRNRHEDIFSNSLKNASRRLRLRGVSLGAQMAQSMGNDIDAPLPTAPVLSTAPRAPLYSSLPPVGVLATGLDDPFAPAREQQAPRLGSPFPGISSRPTRYRGRHAASFSVPTAAVPDMDLMDHNMTNETPTRDL